MSRPATSSRFRLEASASASNTSAGRRLANSSMSLRRRSRPRSGFCANGRLSHFGPPTAPSSTASAFIAFSIAASVKGTPCLSIEQPPTSSSSVSKLSAWFLPNQSSTRFTCAITSGPMPSPARISSFLLVGMYGLRS